MATEVKSQVVRTCDRCKAHVAYFTLELKKLSKESNYFYDDVADLCIVCTELFTEFMRGK